MIMGESLELLDGEFRGLELLLKDAITRDDKTGVLLRPAPVKFDDIGKACDAVYNHVTEQAYMACRSEVGMFDDNGEYAYVEEIHNYKRMYILAKCAIAFDWSNAKKVLNLFIPNIIILNHEFVYMIDVPECEIHSVSEFGYKYLLRLAEELNNESSS